MSTKQGVSAEEAQKILGDKLTALTESETNPEVIFAQTFEVTLKDSPEIKDVNHDQRREEAFQKSTLEGVLMAKEMMDKLGIKYERPPDMFAEMIRPEHEMEKVREKLEKEQQAIQQAQARRLQRKVEQAPKQENKQKRPGYDLKYKKSAAQQKKDKKKAMQARN